MSTFKGLCNVFVYVCMYARVSMEKRIRGQFKITTKRISMIPTYLAIASVVIEKLIEKWKIDS